MNRVFAAILALCMALPALAQTPSGAQPAPDDRAKQWLMLIDDSNYTAGIAQMGAQTRKEDIASLSRLREPMGAMSNRNLKDIKLEKTHPGMPAGQYAVVRYDSHFANRATAVETVTLAMLGTGSWAVVSYRVE